MSVACNAQNGRPASDLAVNNLASNNITSCRVSTNVLYANTLIGPDLSSGLSLARTNGSYFLVGNYYLNASNSFGVGVTRDTTRFTAIQPIVVFYVSVFGTINTAGDQGVLTFDICDKDGVALPGTSQGLTLGNIGGSTTQYVTGTMSFTPTTPLQVGDVFTFHINQSLSETYPIPGDVVAFDLCLYGMSRV